MAASHLRLLLFLSSSTMPGCPTTDKTYRAVLDANGDGAKYLVAGGGSGSVSPCEFNSILTLTGIQLRLCCCFSPLFLVLVGWSFQGGLSGGTGGSRFGLGADQIVQMEMVLPNGYHVKFGPTKWEDASAEGFIVPKTTAVTGLCRSNPEEQDEEEWIWEDCPDDFDVDFMDLWYAVRGGGGGTYGVALSMHLQLHDFVPNVEYMPSSSEECLATIFKDAPMGNVLWHPIMVEFMATYVMTPSVLNVTEEQSRACGCPMGFNFPQCYGEENVSQAWMTFLEMKNITEGAECLVRRELDGFLSPNAPGTRFEGQIPDSPSPDIAPGALTGLLIPRSWVEKVGVQSAIDMIGPMFMMGYYSFASAAVTSDQANSVSQAHRDAGVMIHNLDLNEAFWRDIAPELYRFSDPTKFPPMFGSNHAANGLTGPLKDDWTKPCPNDWTFEERLAGCVSFQESIYGTETLKRLEAIKKVIDPSNMFQCHNCVGTNPTGRMDEEASEPNQDHEEDIVEKEDGIAIKDDGAGSSSSYLRKSSLVIAMMME